jgi:hypothetical protein
MRLLAALFVVLAAALPGLSHAPDGTANVSAVRVDATGASTTSSSSSSSSSSPQYLEALSAEVEATQALIELYEKKLVSLKKLREAAEGVLRRDGDGDGVRVPPLPRRRTAPVAAPEQEEEEGAGAPSAPARSPGYQHNPFDRYFSRRYTMLSPAPGGARIGCGGTGAAADADAAPSHAGLFFVPLSRDGGTGRPRHSDGDEGMDGARHPGADEEGSASSSSSSFPRPQPFLVRVFSDGTVEAAAGGYAVAISVEGGCLALAQDERITRAEYYGGPAVALPAAAAGDEEEARRRRPGVLLTTSAGRIVALDLLACAHGVDVVGTQSHRGRRCGGVPGGAPLSLHLSVRCEGRVGGDEGTSRGGGGSGGEEGEETVTALHVHLPGGISTAAVAAAASSAGTTVSAYGVVWVGTSRGRVLSVDPGTCATRLPLCAAAATGAGAGSHPVRAVHSQGLLLAYAVGADVVVRPLYRSRMSYGRYSGREGPPSSSSASSSAAAAAAAAHKTTADEDDIVSVVFDADSSTYLWAATAGGDVLFFRLRALQAAVASDGSLAGGIVEDGAEGFGLGGAPTRPLARYTALGAGVWGQRPARGGARGFHPLLLRVLHGYVLAVGGPGPSAGVAVLRSNSSGGGVYFVEPAPTTTPNTGGAPVDALAHTPFLALLPTGSSSRARGGGRDGAGRNKGVEALVALVAAFGGGGGAGVGGGSSGSIGAVVYDCALPSTREDSWASLFTGGSDGGGGGGGAIGWLRTPLIVLAIVAVVWWNSSSGTTVRGFLSGEEEVEGGGARGGACRGFLKLVGFGGLAMLRGPFRGALQAQMALRRRKRRGEQQQQQQGSGEGDGDEDGGGGDEDGLGAFEFGPGSNAGAGFGGGGESVGGGVDLQSLMRDLRRMQQSGGFGPMGGDADDDDEGREEEEEELEAARASAARGGPRTSERDLVFAARAAAGGVLGGRRRMQHQRGPVGGRHDDFEESVAAADGFEAVERLRAARRLAEEYARTGPSRRVVEEEGEEEEGEEYEGEGLGGSDDDSDHM